MTTTIDNNQRKFLVQSQGWRTVDVFCNLKEIPTVIQTEFDKEDDFIIYEYWNRKLKRCSKKHLNEMFLANQIPFKIK